MPDISRRQLLGGAGTLVVLSGAAAVLGWAEAPRSQHHPSPPPSPTAAALRLAAAYRREQDVVAQLAATATATPALAGQCRILRTDHEAHVDALHFLLVGAGPTSTATAGSAVTVPPAATTSPTTSAAPSTATALASVPELVQLVKQAASAAAADSLALNGRAAAVLASMSACGAAHEAWLS